jgi:hypothetical protein
MGSRGGVTADGQSFGHVLKAVNDSLDLEVRGGDARLRNLRLEVLEPPALEKLLITATPPAYLGNGPRESPAARIVQIPRGSAVEIACTATKPLSAATMVAVAGSAAGGAGASSEEVLATLSGIDPVAGSTPQTAAARTIVGRIAARAGDVSALGVAGRATPGGHASAGDFDRGHAAGPGAAGGHHLRRSWAGRGDRAVEDGRCRGDNAAGGPRACR